MSATISAQQLVRMATTQSQAEFFSQLAEPFTGEALFDCLPDLTALLIENGADVNAASFGQTPLARLENVKDMNPGPCAATEQVLLSHGARK